MEPPKCGKMVTYERTNEQMNEQTNKWTNKQTNEQTNEQTNKQTNKQTFLVCLFSSVFKVRLFKIHSAQRHL